MSRSKLWLYFCILSMLLVLFAGCGNTSDDKQTTPSTTSSESQPATTEPETTTEESFDFDGYEFTITNGGAFPRKGEDGKFASATDEEWNELYLELENKYNDLVNITLHIFLEHKL
jgi:hypothetical protein